MRAVLQHAFGPADVLTLEHIRVPEPLPTEVRVRVSAAGVNPVDAKVRRGLSVARFMGELPLVLGWDLAGVVESVAPGVTRFQLGDRVFGMPRFPRAAGAYAEFVTAPARQLALIPSSLDLLSAAAVPLAATTAWQVIVDTAGTAPGDRVLIVGAGGAVGRFAAQLALQAEASVAVTGSARSCAALAGVGIAECFPSVEEAVGGGREFDLVVDLVGGAVGARAVEGVRPGGRVITVPSNPAPEIFRAAEAAGALATGIIVEPDRVALEAVAALIETGQLSVSAPEAFPLADVRAVHRLLDEGPHGKMVLSLEE